MLYLKIIFYEWLFLLRTCSSQKTRTKLLCCCSKTFNITVSYYTTTGWSKTNAVFVLEPISMNLCVNKQCTHSKCSLCLGLWWRTLPVLRSTCSRWVTSYVGKPSAVGQPTRPTQPFILSWVDKWGVGCNYMFATSVWGDAICWTLTRYRHALV